MRVDQAVQSLWNSGYRANASTVLPGYVVVLDPVLVVSGGERRIEYKRVSLHSTQVSKFLIDRS
jgi:hypothetical protein